MKFPIKDFSSKCEQIRRKLRIWSHLLKKSLMENFIFCAGFYKWCTQTVALTMAASITNNKIPLHPGTEKRKGIHFL